MQPGKLVVKLFYPGGDAAILEAYWPEGLTAYAVPASIVDLLKSYNFVQCDDGIQWEGKMSSAELLRRWWLNYFPIAYRGERRQP